MGAREEISLEIFEQQWAAPLLKALKQFKFSELSIVSYGGILGLSSLEAWKVWRRSDHFSYDPMVDYERLAQSTGGEINEPKH